MKKEGANVIVGYKGIDDGHECFSAFPYLDRTGKERFGNEFEENEWCDCYSIPTSSENCTIDTMPDLSTIPEKTDLLVFNYNLYFHYIVIIERSCYKS